jgi:hypothetical protein
MDLREIGLGGVDWIRLSQDRDRWRAVVSAAMNLRVLAPRSSVICGNDLPSSSAKPYFDASLLASLGVRDTTQSSADCSLCEQLYVL